MRNRGIHGDHCADNRSYGKNDAKDKPQVTDKICQQPAFLSVKDIFLCVVESKAGVCVKTVLEVRQPPRVIQLDYHGKIDWPEERLHQLVRIAPDFRIK